MSTGNASRFNSCRSEPRNSSTSSISNSSWLPEDTSSLCNSAYSSLSDSLASPTSSTGTMTSVTSNGASIINTNYSNKENVSCDLQQQSFIKESSLKNNNNSSSSNKSSPIRNGSAVHTYLSSSITINGTMPPIGINIFQMFSKKHTTLGLYGFFFLLTFINSKFITK